MIKTNKLLAKILADTNEPKYNLSKCVEELSELTTILTQRINKPTKVDNKDIVEEIGDVRQRLAVLEEIFGKNKIQKRIKHKEKKLFKYLDAGKYKNKV